MKDVEEGKGGQSSGPQFRVLESPKPDPLAADAKALNEAYDNLVYYGYRTLEAAMDFGRLLCECREKCRETFGYGHWKEWLENNSKCKKRMALASKYDCSPRTLIYENRSVRNRQITGGHLPPVRPGKEVLPQGTSPY